MRSSTSNSEQVQGPGSLIRRVALFTAVVAAIGSICIAFGPNASHVDYMGALHAKHERLSGLNSPKVIVIGGSAPAFAVNSRKLEASLCRPVVNMGLHADLGFQFMVQEVEGELGQGDLLVVCLEQDNYSHPEKYTEVIDLAVDRYPHAIGYVPWVRRPVILLRTALLRIQASWRKLMRFGKAYPRDPIYRLDAFDGRGDMTGYDVDRVEDDRQLPREAFDPLLIGDGFRPILDRLESAAERAGAELVFAWPALARSSEDPVRDDQLRQALLDMGVPIIGRPSTVIFPDTAFLDTPYHIKAWGRDRYTERLLKELCNARPAVCCTVE